MKCPQCQFDNPDGMKFCGECGAKLETFCPKCNFSNPPQFKFCGECGNNLFGSVEVTPIEYSHPQSYTPKHLADKILNTRSTIEGERKLVTVLFADVANYTAMSEKLDPEEVHKIMDECFKILMGEIHRNEGTINQFTGDGIMALFGAPLAHEDHAQRACYSALSIQNAIEKYGNNIKKAHGIDFKMRIGLNSGPVIVGSIGDDLRMDYTAIGDTTNLAARIQQAATPGEIWASRQTHLVTQDYFQVEPLGEIPLKGKALSQLIYRVVSEKRNIRTRFEASLVRGMTKFTGRNSEMEVLQSAFEKVKNGQAQVVDVVGDAGVGKSRLVYEFQKTTDSNVILLNGFCVHHGRNINFLPVVDIVKAALEISDTMTEDEIETCIDQKIIGNLSNMLPFYRSLLSLNVDDSKFNSLNPEGRKFGMFEAVRNLLLTLCEQAILIIILEDVHWIDKISDDFFSFLTRSFIDHPVFMLSSYRPEGSPSWVQVAHYQRLGLERLGTDSSIQLVRNILKSLRLETDIERKISHMAGGNPLFAEEIVRELIDRGDFIKEGDNYICPRPIDELKIPDTVQGVLSARLDRLSKDLKRTVQIASVIGRNFELRLLKDVIGLGDEVLERLRSLIDLEILSEEALFPDIEYSFKHALNQEVAYESLLKQKRSEIHGRIARAIEKLYSDNLEKYYELLAHHWKLSDTPDRSIEYLVLAGEKSNRSQAANAALDFFTSALNQIERSGKTLDTRLVLQIKAERANSYHSMGKIEESVEDYEKAIQIAHEIGDQKQLLGCFNSITWAVYKTIYKDDVPNYCEQGLELARDLNDKGAEARLMATYAYWRFHWQGSDEYETIKRAFEMAEDSNQLSSMLIVRLLLSLLEYWRGNPQRSLQLSESTVEKLHSTFNIQAASMLSAFHGYSLIQMGRYKDGIQHLSKLTDVLQQNAIYTNLGRCFNGLGWAYSEVYDLEMSLHFNKLALNNVKTLRGSPALNPSVFHAHAMTEVNLIENEFEMGKYDEALEHIIRFGNISAGDDYGYMRDRWTVRMNGLKALLLLKKGDPEAADCLVQQCLDSAMNKKWKKYIGKAERLFANVLTEKRAYDQAENRLLSALSLLNEVGNPKQLWLTHQALAQFYEKSKRPEQEKEHWRAAQSIIQSTADGLEAGLRQIYLNSEPIQAILHHSKH